MNRIAGLVAAVVISVVLVVFAHPGFTIEHRYIEDFSTSLYKDFENTTAWWDKATGELKLFPFVPAIVGTRDTPGNAYNVAVSGEHAFVADDASGLQVIDISDPENPVIVGTYNTSGNARFVAVDGDFAFVADGSSGLQIIDITNPASPAFLGVYNTPDCAWGVAVSGDIAYVADGMSGLLAIDISNPTAPALVGTCNTPGIARSVAVSGDNAFVADYGSGIQSIDISDPSSPVLVGTCYTPGIAYAVVAAGDNAFVADWYSGLQVIDISDPANPAIAGTCDTPGYAWSVAVSGDRAFVVDDYVGLHVIDISDPASPDIEYTIDTPGAGLGIAVEGEHAFVADYTSGLQVVEISEPAAPALVGTCDTPQDAHKVTVSGDHVYVADNYYGLQVIDISDPATPTLVGTYNTSGEALDVTVSGDYAYVADGTSGLHVIDISDPTTPTFAGTCDTYHALGVTVSGDHAFVADYGSGLQVIDISDPTHPALAGAYDTPGIAWAVTVSGNHAYVADGSTGLVAIDISDPATPTLAGTYNTPGEAIDVTVSGDIAYVADGTSGLHVIDISDPTTPTFAGTCDTYHALGVTVSGYRAFVADYGSGLHVIDISDPTTPALVGTCDTPQYAYKVTVSGDHAYVADGTSGLRVIQVFQSDFDSNNNIGQSLNMNSTDKMIYKARLVATQTDSIDWYLSLEFGLAWFPVASNGSWIDIMLPSSDLRWRSTHRWAVPGVNPTVTHIEIDWLYQSASTDSIVDIPDDQGGWVLAHFTRSANDFEEETSQPIANYGIWRRVDSVSLTAALKAEASPANEINSTGDALDMGDQPVVIYQGQTYVQSRPDLAATSFPPGTWVWVATVPAVQQDEYIASVPTVADSSGSGINHTVLVVTAHTTTPSVWYVSEPDSGWSVDNIAPAAPVGFAVAYNTGSGNHLTWDPSPAEDFHYFRVYRSNDPDFVPSPSDLVYSTTDTDWSDPDYDGWNVYYKITALDYVENESDPASPGTVTSADGPEVPGAFALYPNVPNPFNPSTTIRYDVPSEGGAVTLRIYDVGGRLVRTLVEGPQTAGQKTVIWDGKDDGGRSVASGVYFSRLQAPGYNRTMKMVLLK